VRMARTSSVLGLVLSFAALACNEGTKAKPVSREASSNAPSSSAPASAPAAAPQISVTGSVLETMDAGGYTYMRLSAGGGEVWAAVNQAKVKKGQTVTVVDAMAMDGFESPTLHRKFDRILFGSLAEPGAPGKNAPAASGPAPGGPSGASDPRLREMMSAQHAAAAQGPASAADVKVPRAEGGKTVAEIFAQRKALADKVVTVRGKVVKFLPSIMGRNWVHIRDGSGSADKKDNDLTVTTDGMAAVGDVIVVKGTARIDQDFGAGYAYPVLIEKATFTLSK